MTKGSNHDLVSKRYLEFHGISDSSTLLYYDSFYTAVDQLKNHTIDYMIMNCVHSQASAVIGSNYRDVHIIDTFISPSKPLVVATRKNVTDPQTIAILYPSVANYTDTSKWPNVIEVTTGALAHIATALLAGEYDSAIIYEEIATAHSDVLRIDEELGSPDDAWLVLGLNRTYTNGVLAWSEAPVTRQWRKS